MGEDDTTIEPVSRLTIGEKKISDSLLEISPFISKKIQPDGDKIVCPNTMYAIDTSDLEKDLTREQAFTLIFDTFRDGYQFETLLEKHVEKTSELKIALFRYIKRNPTFYPTLLLNTSLLHEIARSLESDAIKHLNFVIKERLVDVDSESCSDDSEKSRAKDHMNLSLTGLVDASECYAKAGCHKKSSQCEKQAKLVALQLHLIDRGDYILNLSTSQLTDLIAELSSFHEAYIISEAYDFPLIWRKALFDNVILRNDISYLDDYCTKYDLSSFLIEELVVLYKQYINNHQLSGEQSSKLAKAVKIILMKLPELETRYRIYTKLNFDDAKTDMLDDPVTKAILTDSKFI